MTIRHHSRFNCLNSLCRLQGSEQLAAKFRAAMPGFFGDALAYDSLQRSLSYLCTKLNPKASVLNVSSPPKQRSFPAAPVNNDDSVRRAIEGIGDLQTVGPAALRVAKAKMEVVFEAHRLKPGDEGFMYDKRTEFSASEPSEWDE